MNNLILAFKLGAGEAENETLRMVCSIRTFGGKYCSSLIWILPEYDDFNDFFGSPDSYKKI